MTGARIVGIEYALPRQAVTNEQLAAAHPSWNMDAVALRTGVRSRRIAMRDETALDLSLEACERLFARVPVRREQIDALVVCTQTPDHPMPPNACLMQDRLGMRTSVAAFDLTLACSGYVYGLFIAKSFIASGALSNVLLVTGDTYSKLISPDDRGPATLFGDGAAATLVSQGDPGLGEFDLGTDGSAGSCFIVPAGGARRPRSAETAAAVADRHGNRRSLEQIHMDGPAVMAFVQREVPRSVRKVLARAGVASDAVDVVVLHQASRLASEYLERELALSNARYFSNLERVGNTVSASIPIALRDAEREGTLKAGSLVLLVSFGVGLSWGSCLVTW